MKYFYSLLLLVLPLMVFSQNYLPGSITKPDGTTIAGYISIEKNLTPTYVKFKVKQGDGDHSYSAEELSAFQINGKGSYIAYHGRISMDKNRFPYIEAAYDTITAVNTLFLKTIYQGKNISLYSQSDNLKTRYFIAQANSVPQELNFYCFNAGYDDDRRVFAYKAQLGLIAQKNHSAGRVTIARIRETPFEEDGLKKIVKLLD